MALTFSGTTQVFGNRRVAFGTVTFDASYPTGGEAVTAALFDFPSEVEMVIPSETTSGRTARWNDSTGKLLLYTAIDTEASDTSDQSATVINVFAIGR